MHLKDGCLINLINMQTVIASDTHVHVHILV